MAQSQMIAQVCRAIDSLMDYAGRGLGLDPRDAHWQRNRLLSLLALDSYEPSTGSSGDDTPDALVARLYDAAAGAGLLDVDATPLPVFLDMLMGALSLKPSTLQDHFAAIERELGAMAAMTWFYGYCVANTYVRKAALEANPRFESHGLVVTINRAKPEFKTMKSAAQGNSVRGGYPLCAICHENEGFAGANKRTLRTIPVTLGGKPWFWQFSPYGYFNQHGICVNTRHTPMHVDRSTFINLLDFVDRFPGYFLGCNAALPRIGGSVLAHDHYQGGGELLPMHRAGAWATMSMPGYPDSIVEILDWPGTAVRVVSRSRMDVVNVSETIRQGWINYSNRDLDIECEGEDGRQSALSPTVIITKRGYEMSLIFRNNAVNPQYPEGIFHAHPKYFAIKQEPIGLIEAQGLFVLPGRLVRQLGQIEDALVSREPLPDAERDFAPQWEELVRLLDGSRDRAVIHAAIQDELGSVCERILENTAVFKHKELTREFLAGLGLYMAS